MPQPPPGGYHRHTANAIKEIKNKDQAKSGILYTRFDGNGAPISFVK
jgi:hypothetical protein